MEELENSDRAEGEPTPIHSVPPLEKPITEMLAWSCPEPRCFSSGQRQHSAGILHSVRFTGSLHLRCRDYACHCPRLVPHSAQNEGIRVQLNKACYASEGMHIFDR